MTGERAVVAGRLEQMPDRIEQAERAVMNGGVLLEMAKSRLAEAEIRLLLDGEQINGKNAEQRKAQMDRLTAGHRQDIRNEEYALEEARIRLRRVQNEFSAAKAISRLLGGAE